MPLPDADDRERLPSVPPGQRYYGRYGTARPTWRTTAFSPLSPRAASPLSRQFEAPRHWNSCTRSPSTCWFLSDAPLADSIDIHPELTASARLGSDPHLPRGDSIVPTPMAPAGVNQRVQPYVLNWQGPTLRKRAAGSRALAVREA